MFKDPEDSSDNSTLKLSDEESDGETYVWTKNICVHGFKIIKLELLKSVKIANEQTLISSANMKLITGMELVENEHWIKVQALWNPLSLFHSYYSLEMLNHLVLPKSCFKEWYVIWNISLKVGL